MFEKCGIFFYNKLVPEKHYGRRQSLTAENIVPGSVPFSSNNNFNDKMIWLKPDTKEFTRLVNSLLILLPPDRVMWIPTSYPVLLEGSLFFLQAQSKGKSWHPMSLLRQRVVKQYSELHPKYSRLPSEPSCLVANCVTVNAGAEDIMQKSKKFSWCTQISAWLYYHIHIIEVLASQQKVGQLHLLFWTSL